jgi:hypothetical protein
MRVFAAAFILALLAVSPAEAIDLRKYFATPANERVAEQWSGNSKESWGNSTNLRLADFTHTGWKKLCFDMPDARPEEKGRLGPPNALNEGAEACLTFTELRDRPTDIWFANFGVLQIKPEGRTFAVLLMSLGSALPPDPGRIWLDGAVAAKVEQAKDYCNEFGCFGWVEIPHATLDRMKAAREISYVGIDVLGRELAVPLPCCDFAAVFDGAPLPIEAQDEKQHDIPRVLRRRLVDTIR